MKQIHDLSLEDIVTVLPIYEKVKIDLSWENEKQRELPYFDEYTITEYYTETSKDYQYLIDFISGRSSRYSKFHGICPQCGKETYFTMGIGIKFDEKFDKDITSLDILSYTEDLIGEEDIRIPEVAEAMNNKAIKLIDKARFFDKHFACPNCPERYRVSFALEYNVNKNCIYMMKIGQYPQITYITVKDLKGLDKVLDKYGIKQDYRKAVRNSANGDNISSYVYLRRMLEKYIMSVYNENRNSVEITQEEFFKVKTIDKMKMLKAFLPSILNENQHIYSILSKGIHELEEEKCQEYYPVLKRIIDLVFLSEVQKKEEKELMKEVQKIISS